MSQEGIIDFIGFHPEIPTEFIADVGSAVPIANTIELLGEVIAASGVPFQSIGSGNTITYQIQYASAIAASDPTDVGAASFNSAYFTVNADGFVSVNGSALTQTITGNSGGALSPVSGNFNIVGTGSTTSSGSGNTLTVQMTGLTNHAVLVGAGTATITKLSLGSAGQVLQSGGGSADPAWSTATYPSTGGSAGTILRSDGTNFTNTTATYPSTTLSNGLLYSNGLNNVQSLATLGSSVLTTSAGGVPMWSASLPTTVGSTGTILRSNGTGWVASTATYPNTVSAGNLMYASASNTYGNLSGSSYLCTPLMYDTVSSVPAYRDPRYYTYIEDDFVACGVATTTIGIGWGSSLANGGSVVANTNSTIVNGHVGVVSLLPNSATNGQISIRLSQASTNQMLFFGDGSVTTKFLCNLSALSDGTTTYNVYIGLHNAVSGSAPTNGVYFTYTHGTNSGNWQIVSVASSSATTANTSTAADTNWHMFQITVNAGGTSVAFYIDDVEVANSPITTNIQTSSGLFPELTMYKTAGSGTPMLSIDFFSLAKKYTTARY